MTETIDARAFSVNEKPNEYQVICKVSGDVTLTINAESLEAARAKAEAMVDNEPEHFELFKPDEIEIGRIYKSLPMYRVMRDGIPMQVSHLKTGDVPRDPDPKYGF